jgi:EmrB/QacA subfamily drug resistance transporter
MHGRGGLHHGGGRPNPAPPADRGAGAPDPRRWLALAIIDLCLLAVTMDNTILNVALPSIARDLGATGAQLQWMVDAYIVVFAGLLLTSGTLGDRFGRRRMLLAGLSVFGIASAATLLVSSPDQLIFLRGAMGFGGALLMPATLSLITNLFPEEERPRAIATWAAVSGVGMVIGPIVGGALLDSFSWNSVFLVNLPLAAIGLAGAITLMPESRDSHPGRVDPVGAVLSILGPAVLVYGIIDAPGTGWTAPETFARIGAGLVFVVGFIVWELHNREPMFDVGLFARPAFGATSFAETVAHFALVGAMFALTQYLQFVWGQTPLQAGVSMLPIALGVIGGTMVVTRLRGRLGARHAIAAGMTWIAVGLFLVSRLAVDSSYPMFALAITALAGGMGLAMAPATDSIMGAVDKARAGVGSATNDTTRELGSALGVAVFGSILSSGYRDTLVTKLAAVTGGAGSLPPAVAGAVNDSLGSAVVAAGGLPGDTGTAVLAAARESFVAGMSTASLVGAVVVGVGVVLLLHWLPGRSGADSAVATDLEQVAETAVEREPEIPSGPGPEPAYVARTARPWSEGDALP